MASAHITVEQFRNKEIKTEFTAEFKIINQKFDSLNDSVNQRFGTINQRFDSLEREIGAMWRIQIPIFVAILVMMFRLFGVI